MSGSVYLKMQVKSCTISNINSDLTFSAEIIREDMVESSFF
jgi:hypothetical protein